MEWSSSNLHIPLRANAPVSPSSCCLPTAASLSVESAAPSHQSCFFFFHTSNCNILILHCFPASPVSPQSHKSRECFVTGPFAKLLCLTRLIAANALPGCPAGPAHIVGWAWRIVYDLLEKNTAAISGSGGARDSR